MILENRFIRTSLKAFLERIISDVEDLVPPKKMEELEKTRLVFNDGEDCYTTGKTIVIGTEFPIFSKDKNSVLYRQVQGVIVREFAIMLYTNFKQYTRFIDSAPQKYKQSKKAAKHVMTTLEVYRTERKIVERNSFYKKLFLMVKFHIVERVGKELNEKKIQTNNDRLNVLIHSLLYMGFVGHPLKTNDMQTNQMAMAIFPLVKKAIVSESTEECIVYADRIMLILSKLNISDEHLKVDQDVEKLLGKLRGRGTNSPVEKQKVEVAVPGEHNSKSQEKDTDAALNITKNMEAEYEEAKKTMNEMASEYDEELERLEVDDITGDIVNNYFSENPNEEVEAEIEEEEQEIKELTKELPPMHSRKQIVIRKSTSIEKYSPGHYETLKDELGYHIRQTVVRLESLKQVKIEDWQYYHNSGSLDTDSLVRFLAFDQIDIFKNQYPEEESLAMDVMLLVDCSGSTNAQVLNKQNNERLPRYKVNQMIALFLHEVLKALGWRHSVWAFDSGKTENVTPVVPFTGCFDRHSGLKIRDISARNANRDGLHIRLAGKHLAGNAESQKKLLIVLSDGQPASDGYNGEAAMKDVYDSTQELKELGVKTIGVFSGDPSENKYFGRTPENKAGMYENFIFMNNDSITEFPEKLYELLVREFHLDDELMLN